MNQTVSSPCIGVCSLDPRGYCEGCFRSLYEIGYWLDFTPSQREHLMNNVLPEREQNL